MVKKFHVRLRLFIIVMTMCALSPIAQGEDEAKTKKEHLLDKAPALDIQLKAISNGYDRKTCWVHSRPGLIPGNPFSVVVTLQKLRLTGSDIFYSLYDTRSDDGGDRWSKPVKHAETLGMRRVGGNIDVVMSDFWPMWHKKTGVLLGTGHTVHYLNDKHAPHPQPRSTVYSVYNPKERSWQSWKKLKKPELNMFKMEGAGSTQRVDLPNGDILLPTYYSIPGTDKNVFPSQFACTVIRCSFDGTTLKYLEHGDEITVVDGRGFSEPSLVHFQGRFYLTLRNNDHSYITSGTDGLHFKKTKRWTFDDGSDLGSYNTQQHWITMPDALYLVYTRRGAKNDHIMRHRAPLFIAQVDPNRLCVIRETEQILVPERGARLGNFGVVKINDTESWVTVAEWMQTTHPNPHDFMVCEKYGSDNTVWLAKIRSKN